jgi:hypothetical protein
MEERSSGSIGAKIIAGLVIAFAAWLLFKVVIGFIAGIATLLAVVVLIVALIWAFNQF